MTVVAETGGAAALPALPALPATETPAPAASIPGRRWSDSGAYVQVDPNAPWSMAQQWPNLVATLSEQAVESSNLLLRALHYLVGAGRLRRSEAKALSDAMHTLRATSLRAQQITRLASGRIRQTHECLELGDLISRVLEERAGEFAAAGAQVRAETQPVDVLIDPPVAISLLHSVLDWALAFSREITFALHPPAWEGPARLEVRVATPPRQQAATRTASGQLQGRPRGRRLNDGLHWMLLRQIAASAGVDVRRSGQEGLAVLTIQFPRSFLANGEGLACLELDDPVAPDRNAWVLVLAGDPRLRAEAMACLHRIGLETAGAASVQEARALVEARKPAVVVSAYDMPAAQVARLRDELLGGDERCRLVEITAQAPSFALHGFDGLDTPKVGAAQLGAELPAAVLFELVKAG